LKLQSNSAFGAEVNAEAHLCLLLGNKKKKLVVELWG